MRLLISIYIVMVLAACGRLEEQPKSAQIYHDAYFEPFLAAFVTDAAAHGVHVDTDHFSIMFGPMLTDDMVGYCDVDSNGNRVVVVDLFNWSSMHDASHTVLIDHELGHCILGRAHVEDHLSIMNPNLLSEAQYLNNKDALLSELFDTSTFGKYP